MLIQTTHLAD